MATTPSNSLPEGTDTIIAGASATGMEADDAFTPELDDAAGPSAIDDDADLGGGAGDGRPVAQTLKAEAGERAADLRAQAGDKARDYATQGKDRATAALDNVSRMIGDAAAQVDEKVGADYGDYARRAQTAVDDVANALRNKDVDELFADARELVRRSPGIAVGAAAVVGFALVRLIKAGLPTAAAAANADDSVDADAPATKKAKKRA